MQFGAQHTLGNSMDRGLNLVPREGPPTCGCQHTFESIASSRIFTKITALVEPPDPDLDLTAREGGCRLILEFVSVWDDLGGRKRWGDVSSRAKGGCGRNCESGEFVNP